MCILLVAVDPAVRQFQVCANALARGGEILSLIICTSILIYICIHTLVVIVLCEVLSIRCMFYTT